MLGWHDVVVGLRPCDNMEEAVPLRRVKSYKSILTGFLKQMNIHTRV